MRRRVFITLLGGGASWPLVVLAQSTGRKEPPIVGFLSLGSEVSTQAPIEGFRSGLAALGYIEDRNIRVLYRFADGKAERLADLTTELVSLGAKIIVTSSTTAVRAAHSAAPTVPIVSWAAADPVIMGWAQSLARPGGMITGLFLVATTVVKSLELLKDMLPQATTFVYLLNATNPGNPHFRRAIEDAARQSGINVTVLEVREASELAEAFGQMVTLGAKGLAIIPDPMFGSSLKAIVALAVQYRLPTVFDSPAFVEHGGLAAFSTNYWALARRSAWYVDRILNGAAPGDLPAEQATEFKLIINLKTAKTLGLTLPTTILLRANEVVE